MVDIVYGLPQQQSGGDSWIDKLLPIGVLAVFGFILYKMLVGGGTSTDTSGGFSGGSGGGTTQAAQQAQANNAAVGALPGASTLTDIIRGTPSAAQVINLPATPTQPTFVLGGPTTPASFSPGGQGVISVSQELTTSEASKVLANLAASGIPNAWWSPTQTITETTTPGGINSAGSFQSNIPVGQKHCPCTAALKAAGVCRQNDDWYLC